MSIVSHLRHLFNAETCQSYIHTFVAVERWPTPVSPLSYQFLKIQVHSLDTALRCGELVVRACTRIGENWYQSHHVGPWGTYHYQPALSQSCLFEAKSENRISENQWLARLNFPVFGNLRVVYLLAADN